MSTPAAPAVTAQDDVVVQAAAGLADTPMGQRVAIMITVLLPKDAATQIGEAVTQLAGQLSSTRLIVAGPGTNGASGAVGQQPG